VGPGSPWGRLLSTQSRRLPAPPPPIQSLMAGELPLCVRRSPPYPFLGIGPPPRPLSRPAPPHSPGPAHGDPSAPRAVFARELPAECSPPSVRCQADGSPPVGFPRTRRPAPSSVPTFALFRPPAAPRDLIRCNGRHPWGDPAFPRARPPRPAGRPAAGIPWMVRAHAEFFDPPRRTRPPNRQPRLKGTPAQLLRPRCHCLCGKILNCARSLGKPSGFFFFGRLSPLGFARLSPAGAQWPRQ